MNFINLILINIFIFISFHFSAILIPVPAEIFYGPKFS